MIFVKDAEDLRFVRFNKAGEELLGYSSDELIGKNDYDFFPKEEADLFTSKDREVINSKKLHSIKEENISTHKGDRVLSTKKLTICDSFGKPKYLLGISEDITERKKYESELKENEERFKALSNATFEAIFISEKGICIEANKAAIEMFGYNHHELIGIFGTDVIAEESKEIVKQNMLRGFEEPYEAIAIRKDGSKFSAMFHGRMFEYKGRDVRITAIRDITLQKQNEIALKENEQLLKQQNDELVSNYLLMQSINQELEEAKEKAEESDRLKSAFLANMSHEIRTPMNGIVGFSQLMRTKKLTEDQQMKFIKIINNSSMQLLRIVNDIIDVSKIEIGKVDLNYQESNINFLLNELFAFYKPVAGRKNIKLSLQKGLNDEQSLISTDQVKVRQVLDNIISNAVKFTKDGFINFGYKHKDNNLEFYIQDSGIGIPEEQQNIVFDRFMQADSQLSETHSGTGLGLSISKSYIELLGGKIWLESESEKGTTFYFTIPYKV